ncbi:MAG: Mov34/MPN/PAD-1 family protein [Promethearchaeota archaeon]
MKDRSIVTIKPEAYYKMLVHVLRFGSRTRDNSQFKEVMGMLIGYLEGEGEIKDVIIEDAVPISHGGSIEVQFAPNDYITFAAIDEEFAGKNWFTVGWYHSHPNLKVFFSGTDIKNQMGWQTPNPSAIGIVFDHNYLETDPEFRKKYELKPLGAGEIDYGFRTYRLDDPSKQNTGYHEVKTIVELPDNLSFYIKIMNLINKIHANEPLILELNETPDIFGNIYIPFANQLMADRPELEINSILTALKDGVSSIIEASMEPLITFINQWSQDIVVNIVDNNLKIRESLRSLKTVLSEKMASVQTNFKFSLTNMLDQLDIYMYDRLEKFDKDQESINRSVKSLQESLVKYLSTDFKDNIEDSLKEILEFIDKHKISLNQIQEKNKETSQILVDSINNVSNIEEIIDSKNKSLLSSVQSTQDDTHEKLKQKINSLSKTLTNLKTQIKNILESRTISTDSSDISTNNIQELQIELEQVKKNNESLKNKLELLQNEKSGEQTMNTSSEKLNELTEQLKTIKEQNKQYQDNFLHHILRCSAI